MKPVITYMDGYWRVGFPVVYKKASTEEKANLHFAHRFVGRLNESVRCRIARERRAQVKLETIREKAVVINKSCVRMID